MSVFKKIRKAISTSQKEKSYLKSYRNYMETIDRLEKKVAYLYQFLKMDGDE